MPHKVILPDGSEIASTNETEMVIMSVLLPRMPLQVAAALGAVPASCCLACEVVAAMLVLCMLSFDLSAEVVNLRRNG
jgi:hypothetical protein